MIGELISFTSDIFPAAFKGSQSNNCGTVAYQRGPSPNLTVTSRNPHGPVSVAWKRPVGHSTFRKVSAAGQLQAPPRPAAQEEHYVMNCPLLMDYGRGSNHIKRERKGRGEAAALDE